MHILVMDNQPLFHAGVKLWLSEYFDENSISFCIDVKEVIQMLDSVEHALVIVGMFESDMATQQLIKKITQHKSNPSVLVYLRLPEPINIHSYYMAGASGVLHQGVTKQEFILTINAMKEGQPLFTHEALKKRNTALLADELNPFHSLTKRELEICRLVLEGKMNSEIKNILKLSASTIATIKKRIFNKMGVQNNVELTKLAYLYDLL